MQENKGKMQGRLPQFRQLTFPALLFILFIVSRQSASAQPAMQTILIPAGAFQMGSDDGLSDERPAHQVALEAFSIARTPVTNAQFADFLNVIGAVGENGERYFDSTDSDARVHLRGRRWIADTGSEEHPVVEVSWFGAKAFCEWVGMRLPTEAEWEKASRGTDGRRYPWGNEEPDRTRAQYDSGWNDTERVGRFPKGASPYGVLDMAGNAWEWVSSAYRPYPYNPKDGREDQRGGPVRSTRGGGQDSGPDEITTTQRGRNLSREPQGGHHNIGFRCAK